MECPSCGSEMKCERIPTTVGANAVYKCSCGYVKPVRIEKKQK